MICFRKAATSVTVLLIGIVALFGQTVENVEFFTNSRHESSAQHGICTYFLPSPFYFLINILKKLLFLIKLIKNSFQSTELIFSFFMLMGSVC